MVSAPVLEKSGAAEGNGGPRGLFLLFVGASYRTCSVGLRERCRVLPEALSETLLDLHEPPLEEILLLSTCNRTELYVVTTSPDEAMHGLAQFYQSRLGLPPENFDSLLHTCHGLDAARHLVTVAAGLDSMAIGEPEILDQVREAGRVAQSAGTLGPVLTRALRHAILGGRRAWGETGRGQRPHSLSTAAVTAIQEDLGGLDGRTVVVIGTGRMGKLAASELRGCGASSLLVIGRDLEHAQGLANRVGGEARDFSGLPAAVEAGDAVITCAAAPHFILRQEHLAGRLAHRPAEPLVIVDMGVPRNVEPTVGQLPGVRLLDIDCLASQLAKNTPDWESSLPRAKAVVEEEALSFWQWLKQFPLTSAMADVYKRAEAIRQREVQRTLKRLPALSEQDTARLNDMTRAIVNKLLHQPLGYLKQEGEIALLTHLFAKDEVAVGRTGRAGKGSLMDFSRPPDKEGLYYDMGA
ncbi:MAG TPA: glutamyl-tRNA reductase [Dehalococcoidia bacterium]|nr:glutamyl-tRNA reductase [Dehalococcoidia bacterium]